MPNILTRLSRSRFPYEPLVTVEISRSRLLANLEEFRRLAPNGLVAPVLKSNAYGHGLLEVAKILEHEERGKKKERNGKIPFFIVDSYFEAIALHSAGIKTPVLIIGYTRPEILLHPHPKNIIFTVTNFEMLEGIAASRRPIRFHLKVDTGMHRQGVMLEQVTMAMEMIGKNPRLIIEGVCSHLPDADNPDQTFTGNQIVLWNGVVGRFRKAFPNIRYFHLSATDGHRFSKQIEATVTRLGIGLYGLAENEMLTRTVKVEPILEMRTIITGVKKLHPGETVGYGNTFRALSEMTIATVPVGYFEGIDRRLSSNPDGTPRGWILVGPKRIACPVIGRVSMNIVTIDVTDLPDASHGMRAVAISRNPSDKNSVASMAKACDTITYEGAVRIPAHLKRIVI